MMTYKTPELKAYEYKGPGEENIWNIPNFIGDWYWNLVGRKGQVVRYNGNFYKSVCSNVFCSPPDTNESGVWERYEISQQL